MERFIEEWDKLAKLKLKLYGGIDVGGDGGVAFIDQEGTIYSTDPIPRTKDGVDYSLLFEILTLPWAHGYSVHHIVIEDVHSIFGASAKSNFNFGLIKGVKLGFLHLMERHYQIPYSLVQPKKWQAGVWEDKDVVYKEGKKRPTKDTKATSLNAARRLWPGGDFTKSKRAHTPHDGIVDALLMAEFARTHLN